MKQVSDYLALIPSANQGQPNFSASITAAVEDIVDDNNTAAGLSALFDLDTAVGVQLDVDGQWIGLSRNVETPLSGIYFSLDTEGLGLDQGYLKGKFDPSDGVTVLDDTTYRLMLQIKIAANHWDGSLGQAQTILAEVLSGSPGTKLMVIDNFDMTMTLGIAGVVPGAIFIALLKNYLTLRPAAVGLKELVVTSINGAPLFGLDCENDYISGLDVGAFGLVY